MTILTRNELSVLALVASDASYRSTPSTPTPGGTILRSWPDNKTVDEEFGFPINLLSSLSQSKPETVNSYFSDTSPSGREVIVAQFPRWKLATEVKDDATGFGVSIYKLDGANEYIVAFRGTDGKDPKDWGQNLGYSAQAWETSRDDVLNFLFEQKPDGHIPAEGTVHFSGQSLGGGLAQYGAYEFVRRLKDPSSNNGIVFDPNKVSLTTFNSFAGAAGLKQIENDAGRTFKPDLLIGVQTAHYAIPNDLVHRLGSADVNGVKVGLLNGNNSNTFLLDFRRWEGNQEVADQKTNYLGIVEGHRIETGFFQGFYHYGGDFETTQRLIAGSYKDYLSIGNVGRAGSFFAQHFNHDSQATSDLSAGARLAIGLVGGLAVGNPFESALLVDELVDAGYNGGSYGAPAKYAMKAANVLILAKSLLIPGLNIGRAVFV